VNEWQIQDCIDVHKLLETVFGDQDIANSKFKLLCLYCATCYIVLPAMM